MTLDQLKAALFAADPAAVLVPPRLLARVIRGLHGLPGRTFEVPHADSCIIDRRALFRLVEPDDLELGPDRLLPTTVILLPRPALEGRNGGDGAATLLTYWRLLFHANIHLALEQRAAEGRLQPADVSARIDAIGRTEFAEVRRVLTQENYLFPDADDRAVYTEFAAVYLSQRRFLPALPAAYFPAIHDLAKVDQLLAGDVDAQAIFERTRLPGAPTPAAGPSENLDEPSDHCLRLLRDARRAAGEKNVIRAAILRTRAALIAPAALTVQARADALGDLQQLAERLRAALKWSESEAREWLLDLPPLLDKASEGNWTAEARLLYDLQKVCVDHEREIYALDLVEWVRSGGKRPIKRPLTSQRLVRITRHLHSAAQRLILTRLSDADRRHLGDLLQKALQQSEERLRARFRPVLGDALHDVGLHPDNVPEEAAQRKLIEDLLDRVVTVGFFSFSDLRDTLSRNQLKLPDLGDAREFVRGDPLLALDRRLGSALDGVYRPSEIYFRLLQRITSLSFGTRLGRVCTQFFVLPFGGALAALEAVDLVAKEIHRYTDDSYTPLVGPVSVLRGWLAQGGESAGVAFPYAALGPWLALSLFLMALLHLPAFRRGLRRTARAGWRAGRLLLVDVGARLLPLPALRAVWRSWPFQLFWGIAFVPLVACFVLWGWFPELFDPWPRAVLVFVALEVLVNSRAGKAAGEAVLLGFMQLLDWLRAGLVPGLVRLIARAFKRLTSAVEYVLFTVDEWLRFKSGDSRLFLVLRPVLGLVWFPVSYVVRLYMVVLIEPGFNPIKAPISILAAKFVYPLLALIPAVADLIKDPLQALTPVNAVLVLTLWLLPDAVTFLIWEIKENWRLYRANRSGILRPVTVSEHGETLVQLLRPGFHSGRLPKLFAQLRKAERRAYRTGTWRAVRAVRDSLHDVEKGLRRFIEREVVALLHLSGAWAQHAPRLGEVGLAGNLVRLTFHDPDIPHAVLRLALAERGGRLLAQVEDEGWLPSLSPRQQQALARAVTGLYKLAGVELVREQIESHLPPGAAFADVTAEGLVVRFAPKEAEVVYPLDPDAFLLRAEDAAAPPLVAREVVFARAPITWAEWVAGWQRGAEPAVLLAGEVFDARQRTAPLPADSLPPTTPEMELGSLAAMLGQGRQPPGGSAPG